MGDQQIIKTSALELVPFDQATAITLAELCQTVRGDRGGPLTLGMAHKWTSVGWRGFVLPSVALGGRRWLMRQWFDAWQAERIRRATRMEAPARTPRPRTALQATKAHNRAVKHLKKIGMIRE